MIKLYYSFANFKFVILFYFVDEKIKKNDRAKQCPFCQFIYITKTISTIYPQEKNDPFQARGTEDGMGAAAKHYKMHITKFTFSIKNWQEFQLGK